MANDAYDLAKLLADVASGPKVYVVPDNQVQGQPAQQQQMQTQQQPMPREQVRYGEEVPRQSWQQNTASLVDAIGSYRDANPVKIPLPAGTKTLAAKQFDFEKEQFAKEWPYKEASYQYDLNKPYYSPGSGDDTPNKNETLNTLTEKIYTLKDQGRTRKEMEDAIYPDASDLGSGINTTDVKKLLDQIYGESEGGGLNIDSIVGGEEINTMSPDDAAKQVLKERPWWQKAIDILPGKQYR